MITQTTTNQNIFIPFIFTNYITDMHLTLQKHVFKELFESHQNVSLIFYSQLFHTEIWLLVPNETVHWAIFTGYTEQMSYKKMDLIKGI